MNSAPDPSSGARRCRSTRVLLALPLIVRAVDALGRPFQDLALTETVNCHGCRYRAEHLALKNTSVNLEVPRDDKDGQPYTVRSVGPDGVSAFIFGVELEKAGNLWKIPLPKSVNAPGSGVVIGMGVVGIKVLEDAVQTVQKDYRTISISLSPGL